MTLRAALVSAALIGGVALCWPAPSPHPDFPAQASTFRWNADSLFADLESEFTRLVDVELTDAADMVESLEAEGRSLLIQIGEADDPPYDALSALTLLQLRLAVPGAVHPSFLGRIQDFLVDSRVTLMRSAARWPADRPTHEALYQVLFGGRIALDEALIQAGAEALPPLRLVEDIPSLTPSLMVEGVRIHSGDVLLSRGGAPTSALIARGNDFANTFSHAALVHVDPDSGDGTVIESLIEAGSVLSTPAEYLEGKKHRILVLRMRPDHPALINDPLLPHRAAQSMLERVRQGAVPYDFGMEWEDPTTLFCSEVIYHAFREYGVDLWTIRSSMSASGLVTWLAAMGVRQFTSLVPSDLEYDSQMRAVVEWRDAPALMDFRVDNAIIDALLEEADRGAELSYAWYALPAARALKVFSVLQSTVGVAPKIPRGMSPSTALRVDALVSGISPVLKADLRVRAEEFRTGRGYEPPYWVLVELARDALATRRESLHPALTTR